MIFNCPLCQHEAKMQTPEEFSQHCISEHKVKPEQMEMLMTMSNFSGAAPVNSPELPSSVPVDKGDQSDSSTDQQSGQKRRGRPRRDPNAPKKKRGAIEYDPNGDSCTPILEEWRRKKTLERMHNIQVGKHGITPEQRLDNVLKKIRQIETSPPSPALKISNSEHLRRPDVKLRRILSKSPILLSNEKPKTPVELDEKIISKSARKNPDIRSFSIYDFHNFNNYSNVKL